MVEMAKVQVNWSGFTGAPGFTNLYFRDFETGGIDQAIVDHVVSKTDTWISSIITRLPTTVTLEVQQTVQIIESTNGALQRFMVAAVDPPARVGSGTGNYSAVSGAVVNWYTDGVRNGRRIRGRTFLVPIAGSTLDVDGSINNTQLTALRAATTTFTAAGGAGDMGVWSRPSVPGATDGEWNAVSAFTIPDKVAFLSSRRD